MSKVTKTYSGTLSEQLSQYKEDRCASDEKFKQDVEASRFPTPASKVKQ